MAELIPGDPGEESPGAPAPGHGPNGESGGGAAAQEFRDFSETEGNPSQHAFLQFTLGEVSWGINLKLSSYVFIPLLAGGLAGGSMFFAYKMRESPYAGWILLGVAVFSMIVLGAGLRFSSKLLKREKNYNFDGKPPVVNLRRRTPHDTTQEAVGQRQAKKPSITAKRRHRRRPRNR